MAVALQIRSKDVSETRVVSVDYTDKLDSDETLSGTVVATEQSTSDLTISGAGLNGTQMEINGRTVATNKSLSFTVAGGTVGKLYTIQVTVNTSNSQVFVDDVRLQVN